MNANRVGEPLPRRQFLRLSSTAVVGMAAASLVDVRPLFAAGTNLPLLSIGFAGSVPEAGKAVALESAASLLTSDPTFLGRGARLTVAGFARAEKHMNEPGGVQFDAIFPARSRTPERSPRFAAWSFNGHDDMVDLGGPVSFAMPVTSTEGLRFLIHRQRLELKRIDKSAPVEPHELERNFVSLSVNSGGDAKLQRGVYVFAFREDAADRVPYWSRYALSSENGVLKVSGLDLSYMALIVDYNS